MSPARSGVVWVASAVAVLAAALLSGCSQGVPQSLPPAATAAGEARWGLDLRQADCESMTWSVPILATALDGQLPPGFEPSPPEAGAEAPAGIEGATTLGFRAVECAVGLGVDEVLRSVQSGWVYTPVLPPPELREERFASYAFGWDALVAPDGWRIEAAPWGLPLHDGGSLVGPTAQGWAGMLAMDQVGAFSVAGRSLDSGRAGAAEETRTITAGAQGFALWDVETVNVTVSTGVGLWSANPESWVARLIGATQGVATFQHATFDMPSGTVHWPGQALGPVEEPAGPVGEVDVGRILRPK